MYFCFDATPLTWTTCCCYGHQARHGIITDQYPTSNMDWILSDIHRHCESMRLAKSEPRFNIETVFPGMGFSIIKIRRPWDEDMMGFPILVKPHLYIEKAPDSSLMYEISLVDLYSKFNIILNAHIKAILPKGPYLPCVSMAGRALLAGYHRYIQKIHMWSWSLLNGFLFVWCQATT